MADERPELRKQTVRGILIMLGGFLLYLATFFLPIPAEALDRLEAGGLAIAAIGGSMAGIGFQKRFPNPNAVLACVAVAALGLLSVGCSAVAPAFSFELNRETFARADSDPKSIGLAVGAGAVGNGVRLAGCAALRADFSLDLEGRVATTAAPLAPLCLLADQVGLGAAVGALCTARGAGENFEALSDALGSGTPPEGDPICRAPESR